MARIAFKSGVVVTASLLALTGLFIVTQTPKKKEDLRLHTYALTDTVPCTLTKVIDGDTFKCLVFDSVPITVRLACIDAPELKQPFGDYSRVELSRLLQGNNLKLLRPYNALDKYDRYICNVYSDSGFVNMEMVRRGMAFVYSQYCSNDNFVLAEQEAFFNGVGVHSITMLRPWEYRKQY